MKNIARAIQQAQRIFDVQLPANRIDGDIPALAVGVVFNHRLVYQRAWGRARRQPNLPVKPSTAFRIASISKVFTATAILQLVEQGRLRLSDRPERWVVEFKKFPKSHPIHRATIRKILNHTGGVIRDGQTGHWTNDRFPTWPQVYRAIARSKDITRLETGFKYSNVGYAVLGKIIEVVSGLTYNEYVRRNIYRPLKLRSTWTDYRPTIKKRMATGYGRRLDGAERRPIPLSSSGAIVPAAGAISTVADLAVLLDSLTFVPAPGRKILSSGMTRRRYAAVVKTGELGEGYGYGIVVDHFKKHLIVSHGGGYSGYITYIAIDPKTGLGVIVLTNALGSDATSISYGILSTIWYLAKHQRSVTTKKKPDLKRFEGVYRSRWGDQAVAAVGQVLVAFAASSTDPTKQMATLVPQRQANTFRIEQGSRYDHLGELVRFHVVNSKARSMNWGGARMRRIPR